MEIKRGCPFCKTSRHFALLEVGTSHIQVQCLVCYARGPLAKRGEESAVAKWNNLPKVIYGPAYDKMKEDYPELFSEWIEDEVDP